MPDSDLLSIMSFETQKELCFWLKLNHAT